MFLKSVCTILVGNFLNLCILGKFVCGFIFFLCSCPVLVLVILASSNEFDRVPVPSLLWGTLRSIGAGSSLEVWQNLTVCPFSSGALGFFILFYLF